MAPCSVVLDNVVAELDRLGFEVTVNDGNSRLKGRTLQYREYDAALIIAEIAGYGTENNYRTRLASLPGTRCG